LTPLPGTAIWVYAKEKKLVHDEMNWDLLRFTDFQHDCTTSIHLSDQLDRKKLYSFIQKFRWWRRGHILKYMIRESFLDPPKIPEFISFLIKKLIAKNRLILNKIGISGGIRIYKM
jgi:hypothetical protein